MLQGAIDGSKWYREALSDMGVAPMSILVEAFARAIGEVQLYCYL